MSNPDRIRVFCPECNRVLQVPVSKVGRRVRCPADDCETEFEVPDPATVTPVTQDEAIFGTMAIDPGKDAKTKVAKAKNVGARSALIVLAITLGLSGLVHSCFHGWLYYAAQKVKGEVKKNGEDAAIGRSMSRLALLKTADEPLHLFVGCIALGVFIVILGFGSMERPLVCSVGSLLCLACIGAMSIQLPFVEHGSTGGIYYLALTAGDFLAVAGFGIRADQTRRVADDKA